jgi:hypothetical protein
MENQLTSLPVSSPATLNECFDSVVMLTWSDWNKEPRSNRYHFATRFARHLPVIFVQPDLHRRTFRFEPSGYRQLEILHVYRYYTSDQTLLLNQALTSRGVLKPLLWIYNPYFLPFVSHFESPLRAFHATETYFLNDYIDYSANLPQQLQLLLKHIDLLIAVSEEVRQDYIRFGNFENEARVIENGCDFDFWQGFTGKPQIDSTRMAVLYQGGMNHRLDLALLESVILQMPEWDFWFCGSPHTPWLQRAWPRLQKLNNVYNFGMLQPEQVRDLAGQAAVGWIPFVSSPSMYKSLPLKAFEYVAAGLPVVTIPIRALEPYPEIFHFASDAREFVAAIRELAPTRWDIASQKHRLEVAKAQDYDKRFIDAVSIIQERTTARDDSASPLNILVLYDSAALPRTIGLFNRTKASKHHLFFRYVDWPAGVIKKQDHAALLQFDVLLIDYALLDNPNLPPIINSFGGLKVILNSSIEKHPYSETKFHVSLSAEEFPQEFDSWLAKQANHGRRGDLLSTPVLFRPITSGQSFNHRGLSFATFSEPLSRDGPEDYVPQRRLLLQLLQLEFTSTLSGILQSLKRWLSSILFIGWSYFPIHIQTKIHNWYAKLYRYRRRTVHDSTSSNK